MNDIEREEDDPAETHLQKLQCALENLWKHKDFYNQAFAMDSQNDLMERIVRRIVDKNSDRLDQMELEQQQKEKMLLRYEPRPWRHCLRAEMASGRRFPDGRGACIHDVQCPAALRQNHLVHGNGA